MRSAGLILAPFDGPCQDPARSPSSLDLLPPKTHPAPALNERVGLKPAPDPLERAGFFCVQLARCRKRLEQFLVDLLEPIGRSERRHWGSVYVRGLLLDGERKSVEPMSKRLPDGNEQAMHQFVG